MYRCKILNQEIPSEVNNETFEGDHFEHRLNVDVQVFHTWESNIEKFPEKLGEVFENLEHLEVRKSNWREISKENLKQFPKLEKLDLELNQIEKLPRDLFEFNEKLKIINLSSNKIRAINSGLLDKLPNLEEFFIYTNELEIIPGDLFKFNKNLKKISFQGNKIKFIGPELLDGLNELAFADFGANPCIDVCYNKEIDEPEKLNEVKEKIKSLKKPSKFNCGFM
jgi:hypothetical protein